MQEIVLEEATFNPVIKTYWLVTGALVFLITLVGIPLVVLWLIFGRMVVDRHFKALRCEMTEKFLKVHKGVWIKVEKNVPLDQITDLGIVEGPVMRFFKIKQLSVETAGQSAQGALVKLIGIDEVEAFRSKVLAQRDAIIATAPMPPAGEGDVQREMLETLRRIERLLEGNST